MIRRALLAILLLAACGGDDDPAPTAEIVEAGPASLDPADDAADDLELLVAYRDADGDLGGGTAEVHDCRAAGYLTPLDIPPIASDEGVAEGVAIEGMLRLVIADVGAVEAEAEPPPVCADLGVPAGDGATAIFCVLLTDAAGNTGAGDCSDPVAID
jgi:hypothetical protein